MPLGPAYSEQTSHDIAICQIHRVYNGFRAQSLIEEYQYSVPLWMFSLKGPEGMTAITLVSWFWPLPKGALSTYLPLEATGALSSQGRSRAFGILALSLLSAPTSSWSCDSLLLLHSSHELNWSEGGDRKYQPKWNVRICWISVACAFSFLSMFGFCYGHWCVWSLLVQTVCDTQNAKRKKY